MTDFAALRQAMIDRQIAGRGLRDPSLLAAMRAVPREAFVPEAVMDFAHEDGPLASRPDRPSPGPISSR